MRTMWLALYKGTPAACPAHPTIVQVQPIQSQDIAKATCFAFVSCTRSSAPASSMASRSALLALLVAVSCAAAASAAKFTVGDGQWTTGQDYNAWASGKTFSEGDELVFTFTTGSHDVAEVDKSGYDGCSGSSSQNTINNGPATVKLTAGTHYYICTFPGHCSGGMKLAVTVGSGSGGSPSPSTPSTPGTPTTPTPTTPAGPSPNAAPARFTAAAPALAVAAGVLLKLALF